VKTERDLIREHVETALWLAHGLTVTPSNQHLVATLTGALQEICVLCPRAEERERRTAP
jgi:hypothetical protein